MKDLMQPAKRYHLFIENHRITHVIIIDILGLCQHFCTINLEEENNWQKNYTIGIQ
jgi:hypothetical protein